ncbi:pre-mRNA-splicing factor prp46 [Coemansia sp. RSA 1722]|nr:pre-mRNA-splicing factor prp46 [Coemansia sp. RSA 485]KAJ2606059.1 pre-mRNA-splicing factor prp46 [Coemansia sp. RSA 1722]
MDSATQAVVNSTNRLFRGPLTDSFSPSLETDTEKLKSQRSAVATKYRDEYLSSRTLPRSIENPSANGSVTSAAAAASSSTAPLHPARLMITSGDNNSIAARPPLILANATDINDEIQSVLDGLSGKNSKSKAKKHKKPTRELVLAAAQQGAEASRNMPPPPGHQMVRKRNYEPVKPQWHAPWKLMRVISGHIGWVRSLAVEPGNKWFASGSVDRTIKIWDLASGTLKLTLTGHISPVRGLAVSSRHPYLFSCGEDKQVKCWDLETNKVVRQYHGHLSGVYSIALHPVLDILVTGGRDSVARVWDMRTKQQVHVLAGHTSTVSALECQEADPQVISGSMDSTVRLWDLAAGKSMATLTHHKKSVRALALHPTEFGFASASSDSIKQWRCPKGDFVQNFEGHNGIVNSLSVNSDGVVFSGGDDGSMRFWDWSSGHCFQKSDTIAQPGSLDSEAGVLCSTFDRTGFRLITGEADKSIKIWKEDDDATEETHPIDFRPSLGRRRF